MRSGEALGPGASLRGRSGLSARQSLEPGRLGPPGRSLSGRILRRIGLDKPLHPDFGTVYQGRPSGIPYVVVPGTQPRVPVKFEYADESDPGPYPIPPDAPIEGGPDGEGDRHILVIDRDGGKLYELFAARPARDGSGWEAGSGAIFDLNSNRLRPAGWTSADAAGLPVFPGLVRYDEVVGQGAVRHAFRFTVRRTRRAYMPPARHFASRATDVDLPPMGMRVRLKASYDIRRVPAPGAGDPRGPEVPRHDPGRQRRRLVPQRRPRSAVGRRGPGDAQAREGPRLRGRRHGTTWSLGESTINCETVPNPHTTTARS